MLKHISISRRMRVLIAVLCAMILLLSAMLFAQTVVAHRPGSFFIPDYEMADLSPILDKAALSDADYELLFLQTGLGRSAADKLLSAGEWGKSAILETQERFFAPVQVDCTPLLGWFTREDHLKNDAEETVYAPYLADWRPGDIILTLSTHSLGWRHGHAGLVVATNSGQDTLECAVWGTNSAVMYAGHWRSYSNYAVLRVKGLDDSQRAACADYAMEHLADVPYHLSAGFIGPKAPDPDSFYFGLHCSYLVWYAWNAMGYDLDSDGGRLATTYDLLHSDLVEIVQIYGMDPREWVEGIYE